MATALREDVPALTRALTLWEPNAVLLGRSAARVTHWPTVPLQQVSASVPRLSIKPPTGVMLEQASWPDALLQFDTTTTTLTPAASVLWSASHGDFVPIFEALKENCVDLEGLRAAASRAPRGRRHEWQQVVQRVRDSPWSVPEMDFHAKLRRAGIRGWKGNHTFWESGRKFVGDVVFVRARRIVEVASKQYHSTERAIEMDYRRHNALECAGWRLLYVTPTRIWKEPERVLDEVRALLGRRERGIRVV